MAHWLYHLRDKKFCGVYISQQCRGASVVPFEIALQQTALFPAYNPKVLGPGRGKDFDVQSGTDLKIILDRKDPLP